MVAFGALSDLITTRTFFSLDSRGLRFQNANGDPVLQDYMGRMYGRFIPPGYRTIDFISNTGNGPANPKTAFGSSQLTAARKFELDADTVAAANQIAEVTQEMVLARTWHYDQLKNMVTRTTVGALKEWLRKYGNHPTVVRWLKENPPPLTWQGSPKLWAFTRMPQGYK